MHALWLHMFEGLRLINALRDGLRKMDVRIKMAWILVASTYVAAICMIFFKCWPLHRQWQINPDPGSRCQSPDIKSSESTDNKPL